MVLGDEDPVGEKIHEAGLLLLLAAKKRWQRQMRWGRVSVVVGLTLGVAALNGALWGREPFYRSALLVAAALEMGFVPYFAWACRRLREFIALIDLDLAEGLVGEQPIASRSR